MNVKSNIDFKELHEEAQEFYFLEGFSDALATELLDPSDDLIKAIFNRMHGKRITDQIKVKIKSLINSNSIVKLEIMGWFSQIRYK